MRLLQKRIEEKKEFEKYTLFAPPPGYVEEERYWVVRPFAWVAILYNPSKNERLYHVVEPSLTPTEKSLLETLHRDLLDRLPYTEGEDRDLVLKEAVEQILDERGIWVKEETLQKFLYYLKRNYVGYGKIDVLMKDPRIEDISCDGLGIPLFLYHQNYQNLKTNLVFTDSLELDLFVGRLVERAGKQISLGKPTVDASLPEGYRLQATLGKEVTARGSTFTIRKYRKEPFTPVDLIKLGTFSPEMLAYLWLATENKKNIMIIGGTASGKTSTLNALTLFIPPDAKIISIEDTRELFLYQENWVANVTRPAPGEKAITMYDLLMQALRQRPEVLIVGEVRGPEALTLFQAMTTGHTCYSTMHAGSVEEMVLRLEGEPLNVPHHMLSALDIVCLQNLTYFKEVRVRRNQSIVEIGGVDAETGALSINRLFERDNLTDKFRKLGDSLVLAEIAKERGWGPTRLEKELANRKAVLEYMVERDIRKIEEVARVIRQYYFEPEKVLEKIKEEGTSHAPSE
ncbi:MAG: type II/IV secretion system ATPase subunit [Candidatus Hadarchaeales archaeon]